MSSDMDPRTESEHAEIEEPAPWHSPHLDPQISFDLGEITYGRDGSLRVELMSPEGGRTLLFDTPLAVRIVGEGSLMNYWRSGLRITGYNVIEAKRSELMRWLEESSSGVHSLDRTRHFAVFSDDLCIEVVTTAPPTVLLAKD